MKQAEFFKELMEQLSEIPDADKEQLKEYYQELICDGLELGRDEENIIAGFGTVESIVKRIKEEYREIGRPRYTQTNTGQENIQDAGYASSTPIHTINVEAENVRIEVIPVTSGPIRVLFNPREDCDYVSFTEHDGEFNFRHTMRNFLSWNWRNLFRGPWILTLEVPVDFAGNLRVKSSNASISVNGLKHLTNSQFITSNARIRVDDIHCNSVLIQSTNASLDLNNLSGDQLEAVTNNGRVTAFGCTFTFGLLLSTRNGAIEGKNLTGDNIVMKTSNGAVRGTIIGDIRDYAIQSHTVNGSNNLPNSKYPDQKKHLVAKTSNGRIDVAFIR